MALYPQNVLVVLRGELHKVGKGAEPSVLELAESVDVPVEIDLGRHVEEVVLLLLSRAYVEHYDVGYLCTVRRVFDISLGHRVAPVGIQRMVEVDGVEFRLDLVASHIRTYFVVDLLCEVRIFVVIDKEGIAFPDHLLYVRAVD